MADPSPNQTRDAGTEDRRTGFDDLLAGSAFVVLGVAFAIAAARYDVGSALQMGPGYVPLALGAILATLGLVTVAVGVRARMRPDPAPAVVDDLHDEAGPVPWVRGGLLVAAVLVFGLTVRGLGLAGTLFLTTLLAALAGHRNTPVKAAIIAAGLTVMSLLVFVALLQLQLPVVGTWLGG